MPCTRTWTSGSTPCSAGSPETDTTSTRSESGGASLSHEIPVSRYVRDAFGADIVIVLITRTSLKQSIAWHEDRPEFYRVVPNEDGTFTEIPNSPPERVNPVVRGVFSLSYLLKYLRFNARVELGGLVPRTLVLGTSRQVRERPQRQARAPATPDTSAAPRRGHGASQFRSTAAYLVGRIKEENPGSTLVILMDADKSRIYPGGRAWDPGIREAIEYGCARNDVLLVDLQQPFQESYARDGQVLDLVIDRHWNAAAHRIVAETLAPVIDSLLMVRAEGSEAGTPTQ